MRTRLHRTPPSDSENKSTEKRELRVLIVAEHASLQFGGEAALPLHYYRVLRKRSIPTWLVVHARTRAELEELFPLDRDRIYYVADTAAHRFLWRLSRLMPAKLSNISTGFVMRYMTQLVQRRVIRRLIREQSPDVIHQPIPVSPKEPSMIYGMGVPVIIGPMNGGMDYPPAFRTAQSRVERISLQIGRRLANLLNGLIPGKRRAALLLVANERTRLALPRGACHRIAMLVENGVDLSLWKGRASRLNEASTTAARFVFVGRLVDWKAVDLLLLAFKRASANAPMSLSIVGSGESQVGLERLARNLSLLAASDNQPGTDQSGRVHFLGWMSQADCVAELQRCDALVLPSLAECGGAVVLEAMAMEIPVIATAWGGPADYLDPSCGILVEPASREEFIDGLSSALIRLAQNAHERIAMGKAGRLKVIDEFDWEAKVDRMVEHYRDVVWDR